jgi:hypothetical protein
MSKHLTLVFDVENLTTKEIEALTSQNIVRYMAWGHIPYQRDELLEALQELYHLIDSAHDGERVFTTEMQKKARAAIAKARGE